MSQIDLALQKNHVTYTAPLNLRDPEAPTLTLLETRSVLASSGNTGARTWEAALWLGTYLCSEEGRKMVNGKTILELGAGTGFLSILCAKHLQARYVLATDGNGGVVDGLTSNILVNGLERDRRIQAAVLQWGNTLVDEDLKYSEGILLPELVIGADIVSCATKGTSFRISPFRARMSSHSTDLRYSFDVSPRCDTARTFLSPHACHLSLVSDSPKRSNL